MDISITSVLLALATALILIILLLLGIAVFLIVKVRKTRNQAEDSDRRYDDLTQKIAADQEAKKDISRRRYVSAEMRERVMKRDNYTCQICGISRGYIDHFMPGLGDYLLLEVDHILPVAAGGSGESEDNLQTLCWRCNRKKGKNKTNRQVKNSIDYGIEKFAGEPIHVEPADNSSTTNSPSANGGNRKENSI